MKYVGLDDAAGNKDGSDSSGAAAMAAAAVDGGGGGGGGGGASTSTSTSTSTAAVAERANAAGADRCCGVIGLCFMALSALSFSVMSLIVNVLGRRPHNPLPSFELVWCRAVFGLFITIAWARRGRPLDGGLLGPRGKRCRLRARALIGCVGMFCNWYVIAAMPLGDATIIIFTSPLFTIVFARIFLGEPFGAPESVAAVLTMAGVLLVSRPPFLGWPDAAGDDGAVTVDGGGAPARGVLVLIGLTGSLASAAPVMILQRTFPD